jgi:hypothetical protein
MILAIYITLFALAGATTFIAISRRVDERLGGAIAAIMWGRLTAGSFNLTTYSGGSELSAPADGATAIFTATMAVLMVVFTIAYAFDRVPSRDQTRFSQS